LHLTSTTRTVSVIVLAALAFATAYLLAASGDGPGSPAGGLRTLSFPAPAVALPAAGPGLPPIAPAPRRSSGRGARPASPVPPAAQIPRPSPPPPPPNGGGGGGGGVIIEG
jgi:hypothetical protein